MDSVLILIAPSRKAGLDDKAVAQTRRALEALGGETGAPVWLNRALACEFPFTLLATEQAEAAARKALWPRPLDIVGVRAQGRKKALLLAGLFRVMVTNDAPAAQAKGLTKADLDRAASKLRLTRGARALVQTMRKNGARTILATQGLQPFAHWCREACGFHEAHANHPILRQGHLTSELRAPVLDGLGKRDLLLKAAGKRQLPASATLAVSAHPHDREMLSAAGLGVAFCADEPLAAAARLWIEYNDLTALLYLQGYHRDEFAD